MRLRDSTHSLLNWYLSSRSMVLDHDGPHRSIELAGHIASIYNECDAPEVTPTSLTFRTMDDGYFSRDARYRHPLSKLCKILADEASEFVSHAVLHGSLASEDYSKGWSDVDIIVVLRPHIKQDAEALHRFRQFCFATWIYFLQICPLQHHHFQVVADPSYFPLPMPAMKDALVVPGFDDQLVVDKQKNGNRLCAYRDMLKKSLEAGYFPHHPRNGVFLASGFRKADDNMYQLAYFVGSIANIPCYLLQSIGNPVAKRESFELAKRYFSSESWSFLEKISSIRSKWQEKEGQEYTGNAIPSWLQKDLGADYFSRAFAIADEACNVAVS